MQFNALRNGIYVLQTIEKQEIAAMIQFSYENGQQMPLRTEQMDVSVSTTVNENTSKAFRKSTRKDFAYRSTDRLFVMANSSLILEEKTKRNQ